MLEHDYTARFKQLVAQTSYEIELPTEWHDYFNQRGEANAYCNDQRDARRLKVRTSGLGWFEKYPAFCTRPSHAVGIYTRDFSRHGVGILTAMEVYPEDLIRITLPTFWMRVQVIRVRRVMDTCYEIGCTLVRQYDFSEQAFADVDRNASAIMSQSATA